MYNNISKQISIAQEERQQVLILGDFNAKVGTYIEGNKPTMTKRGRQLMKGLWTRVQSQERSILDYVLTNSKLLSTVTEMTVDEKKQYSVLKLETKKAIDFKSLRLNYWNITQVI